MGVRCSLFGCEYDGTEIERDEEHRGDEVILTVREFKECLRCGETELVSENTGVTAKVGDTRGPPDAGTEPAPATGDDAGSGPGGPAAFGPGDGGDTASEVASDPEVTTDPGVDTNPEDATDPEVDAGSGAGTDPGPDPGSSDEFDDPATDPAGSQAPADGDEGGIVLSGDDDSTPDRDENAVEDGPSLTDAIRDAESDAAGVEVEDAVEERPEDDAVILDGGPDDGDGAGWSADRNDGGDVGWSADPGEGATADGDASFDSNDPAGGGGTGTPATGDLASGDWPDHDDESDGRDAWPDHDGEDGGWDATPDDGDDPSVDFSGLTPESSEGAEGGSTGGDAAADRSGTATGDVALADPESEAGEGYDAAVEHGHDARTTRTGARDRLACPSCSFATPPSDTPHRPGDICPECRGDYLDAN